MFEIHSIIYFGITSKGRKSENNRKKGIVSKVFFSSFSLCSVIVLNINGYESSLCINCYRIGHGFEKISLGAVALISLARGLT